MGSCIYDYLLLYYVVSCFDVFCVVCDWCLCCVLDV